MTEQVPWWASEDPWAQSPEELTEMRERIRAGLAAIPADPPYDTGDPQ